MIKQHTAQSLGKYYGLPCQTPFGKGVIGEIDLKIQAKEGVLPILKSYEKLIEPMVFEGKEIEPLEYIYSIEEDAYLSLEYGEITDEKEDMLVDRFFNFPSLCDFPSEIELSQYSEVIDRLIQLGFGAIANSESPTGYVDLFGYICEVER